METNPQSLTRPTLQDILESSTWLRPLPLQLFCFQLFSCSTPFWFPTRRAFRQTQEGCKSITFYSDQTLLTQAAGHIRTLVYTTSEKLESIIIRRTLGYIVSENVSEASKKNCYPHIVGGNTSSKDFIFTCAGTDSATLFL